MVGKVSDFDEPEINSPIDIMRHSCAHVMAHAIKNLWPNAQFGIGPTVENGFYYDVDLNVTLTPDDLPKIESEMKKIIKANQEFVREEHKIDDAITLFRELNQNFKVEIIEDLRDQTGATQVSTYKEGDFIDLLMSKVLEKYKTLNFCPSLVHTGEGMRTIHNSKEFMAVHLTQKTNSNNIFIF